MTTAIRPASRANSQKFSAVTWPAVHGPCTTQTGVSELGLIVDLFVEVMGRCCIKNCRTSCHLHQFPSDVTRRQLWIRNLRRVVPEFLPTARQLLCEVIVVRHQLYV